MFAANYAIKQEKYLRGISGGHPIACAVHRQWIKPLNLKPLAALSLTLLISKVTSFESSKLMPTVITAVLSPV